ncbi:coat protein [Oyster mushroom spherical virus]|uniref:coat protein n=1 Tax=Oyster mushroom spherical virus TaxID=218667 RepID=UPI0000005CCF|nr:coat protein [Oyster mushroom spherical virus]AAO26218.1 coat protein [Oyster mushroom spherical virus]
MSTPTPPGSQASIVVSGGSDSSRVGTLGGVESRGGGDGVTVAPTPGGGQKADVLLPARSLFVFQRFVRIPVGSFTGTTFTSTSRDLNSATFPAFQAMCAQFSRVSAVSQSFDGNALVPSLNLEIVPGTANTGFVNLAGCVRPDGASEPADMHQTIIRPGAAQVFGGVVRTGTAVCPAPSQTVAPILWPPQVSAFIKGPMPNGIIPRFYFRGNGSDGRAFNVYISGTFLFEGLGYGVI